ncbi:hypothetical protein AZI86_01715 [Bdellovibrio bacteriovorus]|uniref:Outer membrane protein beta-barrel domain-containing protein n=1 Tax=Bdellovibrio bacteriovorus TaxID=959 RepID=A0A150WN65_BDEBC|nr:hypothetical protein [Bdellovibrio bacteriovorus]KYG65816.1 hypothetical protein AZI86_01715 [Bdellovibrio bacteriovorus]
MKLIALSFLLIAVPILSFARGEFEYANKLVLRTGVGQLANQGDQGGGSPSVGGFNLQFFHFLNSYLAVGFGYQAQFDLNIGTVPVSGYEIAGRIYWWGEGTQVKEKMSWGELDLYQKNSFYFTSHYGKRQFYLGDDPLTIDESKKFTGEYGVINAGLGWDHRLNRNFEINAELCTSLFALSSTDSRVRISETFLWMGLGYVF